MQNNIFTNFGLTSVQAEIYAFLLENGDFKASAIAKGTKRPRGVAYKGLDELQKLGFIEKIENKKIAYFRAEHPSKLEKLFSEKENLIKRQLIEKEEDLKKEKEVFSKNLPDLISTYNLAHNKPGVKYYEGLEGIKFVINDNLDSQNTIYTYADMEQVDKYIKEINDEYAQKRNKLDLRKKVLLVDSDYTKKILEGYQKSNLEIRFVKKAPHFATIMQIYDNKISYVTLTPEKMIGIIIHDADIYAMHKTLFESMWESAGHHSIHSETADFA